MQKKGLITALIVLVLVVVGFFVMSRKSAPDSTQSSQQKSVVTPSANNETGTETTKGETREITVEADEFSFSPSSLDVTKGEKISLTFKNVGSSPHNFVIDTLNVATKTIPGGGSETVEFTVQTSGTFTFYCSVGNHKSLGMEGELKVE